MSSSVGSFELPATQIRCPGFRCSVNVLMSSPVSSVVLAAGTHAQCLLEMCEHTEFDSTSANLARQRGEGDRDEDDNGSTGGLRAWASSAGSSPALPSPPGVQAESWPRIAAGEHLLATAPTGSGKTLTAFLWSLNQFAAGTWETGHTRVVYISPLKALNTDIRDNLLGPLAELKADGARFPDVRVQTRSGDTPAGERQRMLRRPPEILITTPESLSLLLTTRNGQNALTRVETVILDEVHAIVDNRRGVQLMTGAGAARGSVRRVPASGAVRHRGAAGIGRRLRRRLR